MVCNKSWSTDNNKSIRFETSTDNSTQRDDNNCKKTQSDAGQLTTNANNDTTKACSISEAKRADSVHVAITGKTAVASTKNKENRHFSCQNRHVDKNQKNNIKIQIPTSFSRSFNKKWKGPVSTSTKQSTAYITIKGIESETSYQEPDWPAFTMKELMDNAYDFLNDYYPNETKEARKIAVRVKIDMHHQTYFVWQYEIQTSITLLCLKTLSRCLIMTDGIAQNEINIG